MPAASLPMGAGTIPTRQRGMREARAGAFTAGRAGTAEPMRHARNARGRPDGALQAMREAGAGAAAARRCDVLPEVQGVPGDKGGAERWKEKLRKSWSCAPCTWARK